MGLGSEEHKDNPYIPGLDDDGSCDGWLGRPALMVNVLIRSDGAKMHVLTDNLGRLVNKTEYAEIVAALSPFYLLVADEYVEEFNQQQEAQRRERHKKRRQSDPKPKRVPRPGYVYLLQCGSHYKIGLSEQVEVRIKKLSTIPPFDLELVCKIPTSDMVALERELHERFADRRVNGEWFELAPEDVAQILEMVGE